MYFLTAQKIPFVFSKPKLYSTLLIKSSKAKILTIIYISIYYLCTPTNMRNHFLLESRVLIWEPILSHRVSFLWSFILLITNYQEKLFSDPSPECLFVLSLQGSSTTKTYLKIYSIKWVMVMTLLSFTHFLKTPDVRKQLSGSLWRGVSGSMVVTLRKIM